MTALDLDAVASNAVRRRRFCERCDDPASAECVAGGECEATRCGAHQPAEEWGHIHCWVPLDDGAEDVLRLVAEVRRLRSALAAARREGAEAMREAAAQEAVRNGNEWARGERRCDCGLSFAGLASSEHVTERIRTIPLPEGSDAGLRGAAYRAGAEAMRDALVSALDAMVHAEATEAELFRLTRNGDSAAEHHYKRAVLLEARVTALSLPLPEVTP